MITFQSKKGDIKSKSKFLRMMHRQLGVGVSMT